MVQNINARHTPTQPKIMSPNNIFNYSLVYGSLYFSFYIYSYELSSFKYSALKHKEEVD